MHFGSTLRLLRIDAGLGLRELARQIGVSSTYLSRVEHGHDPVPTPDRLVAIAHVLGVSPTALLELGGQAGPELTGYMHRVPAAASLMLELARRDLGQLELARIKAFVEREFPSEVKTTRPSVLSLLSPERVVLDLKCSDWDDVVTTLVSRLALGSAVSPSDLVRRIHERDGRSSSWIGGGFALPHALVPELEPVAALALLSQPLAADTPDGAPIEWAALVMSPRTDSVHLERLSGFARFANSNAFSELRRARSATHVLEILRDLESTR